MGWLSSDNPKYITFTSTAGVNYVTVLELHRWLQDLADDASSTGDDYMDITRDTPSDKSFDTIINLVNSFNIDDTTAEYIYGGSIIQAGGDVIYDDGRIWELHSLQKGIRRVTQPVVWARKPALQMKLPAWLASPAVPAVPGMMSDSKTPSARK